MNIAYHITAHGYGHAVRSCDVLRALFEEGPDIRITAVTGIAEDFLRNRLPGVGDRLRVYDARFDLGMVQVDSVRVDVPATLSRVQALLCTEEERINAHTRWLRQQGCDVVVVDIPAMPIEAASRLGIPSIAIGNFSWAWIYEGLIPLNPAWAEIAERFTRSYSKADLLLRLPFSPEMLEFPRRQDVGLLSRPGSRDRARLAAMTGADPGKHWILLSFTTLDWDPEALQKIGALTDIEFFTILPLSWDVPNIHAVNRDAFSVANLFATVDAVVTKPGYGVLSECVANHLPIIHVDRDHFRETPVLQTAISRYLHNAFLSPEDLYSGNIRPSIDAALSSPLPPETLPAGGDRTCARAILEMGQRNPSAC